jgi:hypothetical protein
MQEAETATGRYIDVQPIINNLNIGTFDTVGIWIIRYVIG